MSRHAFAKELMVRPGGVYPKYGAVETRAEAARCAELFKKNALKVDGIIVTLPNFGDERGIAEAIRLSGLDVPVLVQATPDDPTRMGLSDRRDSFCGKLSACNNLVQYGVPFTLTKSHTVEVDSPEFREDLAKFAAVCRVVKGMRHVRIGAIGARPAAFNTVRYSEKILEAHGISVETLDLSEVFAAATKLRDSDRKVAERLAAIKAYVPTDGVKNEYIAKMAKLAVVIDDFAQENALDACAVQCWLSMEIGRAHV
jgi:L-fucose isomerase-like protein